MKSSIQKEKIVKKLNLLENHILDLVEYNNLKNYQNIKNFTIKIEYRKESLSYNYTISILRGANNPHKTMTLRFNSQEKICDLISNMIKNITNNKYLLYTSFGKDYKNINRYIINFKNNVSVEFYINDDSDYEFYKNINDTFNKNIITNNSIETHLNIKMKDDLQKIKAKKIINNIDNIFSNIMKLNDIDNYENNKPYKLLIRGDYNNKDGEYLYNFVIIRGNLEPEIIAEYSLSIYNNEIVLEELNKLIEKYLNSENLMYKSSYNNYKNINYVINLKRKLSIEICNNIEKDNEFYSNIFRAPSNEKKLIYNKK